MNTRNNTESRRKALTRLGPHETETEVVETSLAENSQQNAVTSEVTEANANFFQHLELVYSTTNELVKAVDGANNTKRIIKTLVASLANATKGLKKWSMATGRVRVSTQTRDCQTEVREQDDRRSIGIQTSPLEGIESVDVGTASVNAVPVQRQSYERSAPSRNRFRSP